FFRWRTHQRRVAQLIERLISQWRPDLAHYHTNRPLGEECLTSIHSRGIRLVAMLHEAWLICPRLMLLRSPVSEPCPGPGPLRCLECLYSHYDGTRARAMLKLPWRLLKLRLYPLYRLMRRATARQCLSGAIGVSRFMARQHEPYIQGPVQSLSLGVNLSGRPI